MKHLSQTPTDMDIQAFVDSQLDWEEEKVIWSWINRDPVLYARYQELLSQKKLLLVWWESEQRQSQKKVTDTGKNGSVEQFQ